MVICRPMTTPIIIGISGASGAIYGIRLLQALKAAKVPTHLIISKAAAITISTETSYSLKQVQEMADFNHAPADIAASISSGSYKTLGMVIAPCSMKTLAEIASGVTGSLLSRAADVTLKERRKLVLMTRETPLNLVHIRNMATVTEMGGIIAPPVPAFYTNPTSLDELINHSVGRVMDIFGIDSGMVKRWQGIQ
jgi:4-hydroxy-3-polyprenylbenzoate decarboxylase